MFLLAHVVSELCSEVRIKERIRSQRPAAIRDRHKKKGQLFGCPFVHI